MTKTYHDGENSYYPQRIIIVTSPVAYAFSVLEMYLAVKRWTYFICALYTFASIMAVFVQLLLLFFYKYYVLFACVSSEHHQRIFKSHICCHSVKNVKFLFVNTRCIISTQHSTTIQSSSHNRKLQTKLFCFC